MRKPVRRRAAALVTIDQVAHRAGVSLMTVSRVTNGHECVRERTRERVMRAIRELNYKPNPAARALAAARADRIALLYANPSAGYLSELLLGTLDGAGLTGCQLVVQKWEGADGGGERARARARQLARDADGVLLPPPLCESQPLTAALEGVQVPCVAIAAGLATPGMSCVRIDNRRAAHDMTTHLIRLGHRAMGFIKGDPNQSASAQRFEGFRHALADAGVPFNEAWVAAGDFSYRSGLRAAEHLLAARIRPTAIFASNDDMAHAVISVAQRRRLSVPRDLSVAGFDDTLMATTVFPELTTVRQPIAPMSQEAIALLLEATRRKRLNLDAEPEDRLFEHELIERDSCAPPRGASSATS